VNTTFTLTYTADEVPGLDPTLSLSLRNFQLQLKNPLLGTIQNMTINSNLPSGRADYKKEFVLSDKKIKKNSLKIIVNGVAISSGFQLATDGKLKFDLAPLAGSVIKVSYIYEKLKDAISLKPIVVGKVDVATIAVFLNGIKAKASDYSVEKTIEGRYVVSLQDSALADADPYNIFANNGLHIDVKFR
jgi:hypothetical protein